MTVNREFFSRLICANEVAATDFARFGDNVSGEQRMGLMANISVIFSLAEAPALAGMIQLQEGDEAVNCQLRGAAMVTAAPESSVVFPQDASCIEAAAESREALKDQGVSAIEIAGYSPAHGRHAPINQLSAFVPSAD